MKWRVARHGSLQNKDEMLIRAADQEAAKSRVARHGCLQLSKAKMQIQDTDLLAHLLVYTHLCEDWAGERRAPAERPPRSTEENAERKNAEKERGRGKSSKYDECHDAGRACGPGQRSFGLPMAFFQQCRFCFSRDHPKCTPAFLQRP